MKTTQQPRAARILIVDDEEIVLFALRDTLLREGYQVVAVSDGLAALKALKQEAFDAILSDHMMPRLTGLEFLVQAREMQPDCPRILISAVLSIGTVIEAINKAEIHRFILKPWQRADLLGVLRQAVQRHFQVQETYQRLESAMQRNRALESQNAQLLSKLGGASKLG